MPRIRTIKPEFWKDFELATSLSRETRLLYIGMWNFSDDHGVIEGPAERIKAEIFPYEPVNMRKMLSELIQSKRVIEYQVQESTYFWLPKLSKNQRIDRPRDSNLPMPSPEIINNHMKSHEIIAVREGKVRDSKGGDNTSPLPEEPTWGRPEHLRDLYNTETPDECPAVTERGWSDARKKKAKIYLNQFPEKDFWLTVFDQIHHSNFLRGLKSTNGHAHFKADFDWLLSKGKDGSENCVKTHDGRYRDEGV